MGFDGGLRGAPVSLPLANSCALPHVLYQQDGLESIIVAAMPPAGEEPQLWELKLGQYTNRSLSLEEYRAMIDGWATWAQFPAGYEGPAFTYAYFEPVEGERFVRPPLCCYCMEQNRAWAAWWAGWFGAGAEDLKLAQRGAAHCVQEAPWLCPPARPPAQALPRPRRPTPRPMCTAPLGLTS